MNTIRRNLILILLAAFAVRLVALSSRPLWYDEAMAVLYTERSYTQMVYGIVTPVEGAGAANVHPLLYYVVLHNWIKLVGDSTFVVRYLSVLLNLVGLGALYSFVRRWLEQKTALTTLAVAAVAPFVIHYAQETRMYALMATLALLASAALLHRRWFLYAICAALTVYTQNLGAFYLAVFNVVMLYRERKTGHVGHILLANAAALALYSPWMILVLPGQIGFVGRGYWIPRPAAAELIRTLIAITFNLPLPGWAIAPALATALLILTLLLYRIIKMHSPAGWLLVFAWGPVLLSFTISQWQPIYLERSFLPGVLMYCGAVGWLLARGGLPKPLRYGLLAASILLTGVGLTHHYTFREFPNSDFPALQARLRGHVQPGDLIVHDNKLSFFPATYYDATLPQVFLPDPPGPTDTLALPTQEALGLFSTPITGTLSTTRLWFVTFDRAIQEAQGLGLENTPNWLWYAERCQVREESSATGDLHIYVFEECQDR